MAGALHEKCLNLEFFQVRIFLHLDWLILRFTDKISIFSPNTVKRGPEKQKLRFKIFFFFKFSDESLFAYKVQDRDRKRAAGRYFSERLCVVKICIPKCFWVCQRPHPLKDPVNRFIFVKLMTYNLNFSLF